MTEKRSNRISRRTVLRRGTLATGALAVGSVGFSGTALASECPRTPGYWANKNWCEVPGKDSDENVVEAIDDSQSIRCVDGEPTGTFKVADVCKSMEGWQEFLTAPTGGDKARIMAKAVVAANLNFARLGEQKCLGIKIDLSSYGLGDSTKILGVESAATDWLTSDNNAWPEGVDSKCGSQNGSAGEESQHGGGGPPGKGGQQGGGGPPGGQRDWVVKVDGEDVDGEPLKNVLDDFNNDPGRIGLPREGCGCLADD